MKKTKLIVLVGIFALCIRAPLFSHCEIPCGIYNDEMRFDLIQEHIQTIEKSISEITHLSEHSWKAYKLSESPSPINSNQMVRWIINKENHAEEIQHIITQYFLTQRVKPTDKTDSKSQKLYLDQLSLCHEILIYAMKTKQSLDLSHVESLKNAVTEFKKLYLGSK